MADGTTSSSPLWLASATLWRREMVRFFRQRNRVIGALATPAMFWVLLGAGFNKSFIAGGAAAAGGETIGYSEYFYPGTVMLMVLFTAIFSTISVIEDRREGFLQGVLVSPSPRLAIVLGKVLGGASIATIQGILLLLFWPLLAGFPGFGWMVLAVALLFVIAVGVTGIGLCFAWPMDSTAGFHAVMNLVLMPMWFLSGAMFPMESAPGWLKWVMWVNPMTYGQSALQQVMHGGNSPVAGLIALPVAIAATAGVAVGALALGTWVVGKSSGNHPS
jgi:ABC-2 type transport system permease protein